MDIPPIKGQGAPDKTVAGVLGQMTWLLTQSSNHKHMFISDIEWLIMPPLAFKQFRIFYHGELPVAMALWAYVSDDVEARLKTPNVRLQPGDWRSGKKRHVVELIAPFGAREQLLEELQADFTKEDVQSTH